MTGLIYSDVVCVDSSGTTCVTEEYLFYGIQNANDASDIKDIQGIFGLAPMSDSSNDQDELGNVLQNQDSFVEQLVSNNAIDSAVVTLNLNWPALTNSAFA